VPSSLVMGGRRVKVERPRACGVDGHELSLPSGRAWSSRGPLDERAFKQSASHHAARGVAAFPKIEDGADKPLIFRCDRESTPRTEPRYAESVCYTTLGHEDVPLTVRGRRS
jgi:hypothetical protein